MVADLTAATPLTELPSGSAVDAAVRDRIVQRDTYNTTVVQGNGPTAVGSGATATTGLSVAEAIELLQRVQQKATALATDASMEVKQAADRLEKLLKSDNPSTGEVVKQAGSLRKLADKVGVTSLSAATGSASTVLTELALGGIFS